MNKTVAALLLLAGIVIVIVGLVLGFSDVSAQCGSVFSPAGRTGTTEVAFFQHNLCKRDLSARSTGMWIAFIVAAAALIAGVVGLTRESKTQDS